MCRAVAVWLTKPQVANRRLFGSQLRSGSIESVSGASTQSERLVRVLVPRSPELASAEETVEWRPQSQEWLFSVTCQRDGHCAEYAIVVGDPNDGEPFAVRLDRFSAPEDGIGWLFDREWFSADFSDRLSHWYSQALMPAKAFTTAITAPMRLLDVERYVAIHRGLKNKYGHDLIASWSEKTSAEKFVYEDLAIAAYLVTLWEKETTPVQFVDLGCGNGLLVHLLLAEGFRGVGLDVRRRGIWDRFPSSTGACLREATLDPSSHEAVMKELPPDCTWLLGNHSDELTPWLPILAARHSPSCAFFVLPCCPHDLFGKFAPRSKGVSRYRTYLDFVGVLGSRCGFRMEQDVMRIPSTRRTCWVGWPPAADVAQRSAQLAEVAALIEERRGSNASFAPRPAIEPVKNCTKLPEQLRQNVTAKVFEELLSRGERKRPRMADEAEVRGWNAGGEMTLAEVSRLFERQVLQELKAQHGGLQTLLRNHHQAFDVRNGRVRIRQSFDFSLRGAGNAKEVAERERLKAARRKTKPCWMRENHPDGCPRTDEQCPFSHEPQKQ